MHAFLEWCKLKAYFKLVIWLEKEYETEKTTSSKRGDPVVVRYSIPKYDKKNEKYSIEKFCTYYLKVYQGKYRFAQLFDRRNNTLIKIIHK